MVYTVALWGAGNTGRHALRQILDHPDLRLVGLHVNSADKDGVDAGTLIGRAPVGISASRDPDALLSLGANCLVHLGYNPDIAAPMPGTNSAVALDEVCRFLQQGTNVVAATLSPLTWPEAWGSQVRQRIVDSADIGGTTFRQVGVAPGFMTDALPLVLTGACERIDSLRCQQIADYSSYDDPARWRLLGFGLPIETVREGYTQGVFLNAYGCGVQLMADRLGLELDEIIEEADFATTESAIALQSFTIPAGTVAAFRFAISGIVAGRPRVTVEHVIRLSPKVAPDWPQLDCAGGYRAIIEGKPAMRMTVELGADGTEPVVDMCVATAALITNTIPAVCDAPPGMQSFFDSAPAIGRHRVACS